jgi:hypothetical protein
VQPKSRRPSERCRKIRSNHLLGSHRTYGTGLGMGR